ncbi:PQQ-like beta-propeller repeat protein [Pseudooceanicola sp.]|uniref:PQQ-like beta-propeller repeat protein n=1 Tax=Pseudooceanicola sp. TaxID=1914328 RepID=UPI00263697DD|nr:PQQ-like beta-propeller repeat protein [Pseudooceanicola sp.]MDF1856889.1 PQQ-binding-like beta-propeller repeat protein [Pseudooceanicola sp.]
MAKSGEVTGTHRPDLWARRGLGALLIGTLGVLAACDEREIILPGKREDPRSVLQTEALETEDLSNRNVPISLPKPVVNANWLQRSGTPSTRVTHPALSSALQLAWAAPIGAGDGRRNRITADPVVSDSRIFTLDAEATVTATSTAGQTLWQRDLVPARENARDASGGGLAMGEGKLFVTSGFGLLSALDPVSGAVLWQQDLDTPANSTPTYYKGVVYLVAGDATATAVAADNGRVLWQLPSATRLNGVLGGAAPALTDDYAIFPHSSGEIVAAFRRGGVQRWQSFVAGRRDGIARANLAEVTGDPVVVGDTIYVGTHSGRLSALSLGNGDILWTAPEGPLSAPVVIGGSLFIVSDRNEVLRLDAKTGARIWGVELPFFVKDRPKQQKNVFTHYGPIVAGGQVIVASNDGVLRVFDPRSGALTRSIEVPGGATVNPVVAGGTLYVVSSKGQLLAYR